MTSRFLKLRRQHLEENIEDAINLIREFDNELKDELNPSRRSEYKRRIKQLKELWNAYEQEYEELCNKLTPEEPEKMQIIACELNQMNSQIEQMNLKINALGKIAITGLERLDQNQRSIQKALEANRISDSEIQELLTSIQQTLVLEEKKGLALPPDKKKFAEFLDDSSLDAKQKLILTLPIIPSLIAYETELELGAHFNLKASWERFRKKIQGR
jgi:chromosome segregation ATPase